MSQDATNTRSPLPTKTDQRALFYASRKQGHSVLASSRIAGVSRATGTRWEKASAASQAELSARAALVATKQDIASELTRIGLYDPEVAPRDKVNALATVSKVLGYDAPTRQEITHMHVAVRDWVLSGGAPMQVQPAVAQPALGPGEPPIETAAKAISPSQNISQNSEKVPK